MKTMAAALAGVVLGAAGFLGAQPPSTPVAFLDINKVFMSYPRAKKVVADLRAEDEKNWAAFEGREKDLTAAAKALPAKYDPGTPEYDAAQMKLELESAALQLDKKFAKEIIQRKQVVGMAAVYKEVVAEAQRIAVEKGYSCVFNIESEPVKAEEKGQFVGVTELQLKMALRTSVWADPANDITKDVIEALEKAK